MAKTLNIDTLDALLAKGQELKALLESSPEIAAFAAALSENAKPVFIIPGERFICVKEAGRILGVGPNRIYEYVAQGRITAYYTPGSNHRKFLLSELMSIPKLSPEEANSLPERQEDWGKRKEE